MRSHGALTPSSTPTPRASQRSSLSLPKRLEAPNSEAARANAIGLYTMLVGTLQLARAVDDDALSREVLECGIKNAEAYLTQRASAS